MATSIDARNRADLSLSDISRRELYFFNLFRVLQATVIAGLIFSPLAMNWVQLDHPLIGRAGSLV
ncbi:MAG TPA: two-component sensor histidine kinase, partial [Rudaea sp.]|nr:two-component sensor histidine kinase [Rudaea sp.]